MKYKDAESLKKNRDFQLVYKTGTSYVNKYLVMYARENQLGKNRIGISVSKKVGNSVVRHPLRSGERRVGEEGRSRGAPDH